MNVIITAPHIHIRTSSLQVLLVSKHGTLHPRDISSTDNIAKDDIPDIDLPTWFELHFLPYNDVIVTKLQMIGKDLCVEDLKLFKPHHIQDLFRDEDAILMLWAELAWEDSCERYQYSFKKPNPNLKNLTEASSYLVSSGSNASPSTNKEKINVVHKNRMPSAFKFGFFTEVTKTKAEKIRERDERGALRKNQKLENFIINIDDDDIDFGGLGVGGDTVEDGDNVPLLVLLPYDYCIARRFLSNNLTSPDNDSGNLCWG